VASLRATVGWALAALAGGGAALGMARRRRDATPRRLRCVESQRLEPACRVHLLSCDGRFVLVATTRDRVHVLARWRSSEPRAHRGFPDLATEPHEPAAATDTETG